MALKPKNYPGACAGAICINMKSAKKEFFVILMAIKK